MSPNATPTPTPSPSSPIEGRGWRPDPLSPASAPVDKAKAEADAVAFLADLTEATSTELPGRWEEPRTIVVRMDGVCTIETSTRASGGLQPDSTAVAAAFDRTVQAHGLPASSGLFTHNGQYALASGSPEWRVLWHGWTVTVERAAHDSQCG